MVGGLILRVWRHPRPDGAVGRCIGRTDLPVDPRRAKRLAHRIRRQARRDGGPRVVWTSHLRRGKAVGRWLARWGWGHRVDPRLAELDFGAWDGLAWPAIGQAEVEAWCADFADHRPGGGESLSALMRRCSAFLQALRHAPGPTYIVGHGGWINAARRCADGPTTGPLRAADWPAPVAYGAAVQLSLGAGTAPISA